MAASRTEQAGLGTRRRVPLYTAAFVLLVFSSAARAQDTAGSAAADSTLDSLRARLERAEEAIELLRQQMATQASAEVRTRSRARLEISGRVLVNAFANTRVVNNPDVPQFAIPTSTPTRRGRTGGLVARQSTFAFAASGLQLLGGEARADASFDLFGGQGASAVTRPLFPLPRLRILRGIIRWQRTELLVGQDVPLIAQWNPESVASIGTPNFATAGNLWNWLPQIRLTRELAGGRRRDDGSRSASLGVQGAITAPVSGEVGLGGADGAESAQRPFLQTRVRVRWGSDERPAEVGIGAHQGWVQSEDSLLSSHALAGDFLVPLSGVVEVRGEVYAGQLLRGLGGGGIGQNFGATSRILRDRGGWAQLNVRPAAAHAVGAGCGVDDPNDDDQPASLRNLVCAASWTVRPGGGPFLVGLEFRHLETTGRRIPSPVQPRSRTTYRADHFNLAVGLEF